MKRKIALSIAGSDPCGGAGIQADLKTFNLLKVHGITAVTCITSQNTQHVKTIHKLPVELIENQIDVLYEDMQLDMVKTGMLYDEEIVKCVAKKMTQYNMKTVVDPIMIATSGDTLSQKNFVTALKTNLLPKAYLLTPNIQEACTLTGKKIEQVDDVKKVCKELFEMGPQYVLIKGGHLNAKDACDVLFDGKKITVFSLPQILDRQTHGSGCTLSALITGLLALGKEPIESVRIAKHILWNMIDEGYNLGKGADVLNHSPDIQMDVPLPFVDIKQFDIWFELKNAIHNLIALLPVDFIPEVGINMGYALPHAKTLKDICAINGRIIKTKNRAVRCGGLEFGASKHVASVILTTMSFDQSMRSGMNIKYSSKILERCGKAGLKTGSFNRKEEPDTTFSSMEWGTNQAITKLGFIPDIIYDTGDIGKEPMVRILGKNPSDIVKKIEKIAGNI